MFKKADKVLIVLPKIRPSKYFTGFSEVEKKIFGTYTKLQGGHVFTRSGPDVTVQSERIYVN